MVKWTKKDIKRLTDLYKDGKTSKEIAAKMKRSFASVTQKVYNLQRKGLLEKKNSSKEVKKKKTSKVDMHHLRAALGNTMPPNENLKDTLYPDNQKINEDESSFKISKTASYSVYMSLSCSAQCNLSSCNSHSISEIAESQS